MPSLFCESAWRSRSPYINHFIQPNTIIPDQSNPQNWNRYSYGLNNPLLYMDPSGHSQCQTWDDCDDLGLGTTPMGQGASNKYRRPKLNHFADEFTGGSDLILEESWEGLMEIDSTEWENLLAKIGTNVHDASRIGLLLKARNFDTPFFDRGGFFGIGKLLGIGCLNGKCYDRSELNYVLQGELWARMGVSKEMGHLIVYEWKQSKVYFDMRNPMPVSNGTIEMFDLGYDYYNEQYPLPP